MQCPTCKHENKPRKKVTKVNRSPKGFIEAVETSLENVVHAPGKCRQCNCGQSEMVHGDPSRRALMERGYYIPKKKDRDYR